jgi:hypothetical protein
MFGLKTRCQLNRCVSGIAIWHYLGHRIQLPPVDAVKSVSYFKPFIKKIDFLPGESEVRRMKQQLLLYVPNHKISMQVYRILTFAWHGLLIGN